MFAKIRGVFFSGSPSTTGYSWYVGVYKRTPFIRNACALQLFHIKVCCELLLIPHANTISEE